MKDFAQKVDPKLDLTMCISEPKFRPAGPRARTMSISEPPAGRRPEAGRIFFKLFFLNNN